ncbi:Clp protease N-terminal domain-containing protein [Shinella curvata]|uniref:Clp protease N-terminal domain-containing protein n=1 Tax=Shinella curvata TaxID=1817964 RepID=A0ABT8XFD3_9HYPH|nr:Clp protease N-terminal domain-containing protein [Shinella curvata]MCJ8053129.1 Clp protease N-terminal domain-containing protein [Shinella curvata]MDO6122460.1 Clp protease N-terminal domain-containing protein [Shinella curvata]
MFSSIKARFQNIGTIKALCEGAERHAREDGQRDAGAEHFLLAAFDLPDGTARRAFAAIGADSAGLRPAIERQYADGLKLVGLDPTLSDVFAAPAPPKQKLYDAAPSGQAVMQALAAERVGHRPLLGAHVVDVVAGMPHGVAARALRVMGIDAAALQAAALNIIREKQAS